MLLLLLQKLQHQIPVEANLPVGNNFEDHTMLFLLFRDNSPGLNPSVWSYLQYQLFRSGIIYIICDTFLRHFTIWRFYTTMEETYFKLCVLYVYSLILPYKVLYHYLTQVLLQKAHLEADAFFGDDKQTYPYFQVSFYSVPAPPSFVHEFAKFANLNPHVLLPIQD